MRCLLRKKAKRCEISYVLKTCCRASEVIGRRSALFSSPSRNLCPVKALSFVRERDWRQQTHIARILLLLFVSTSSLRCRRSAVSSKSRCNWPSPFRTSKMSALVAVANLCGYGLSPKVLIPLSPFRRWVRAALRGDAPISKPLYCCALLV